MRRPWAVLARQYAALLRMKYGEMLAYRPATFVWMTGAMVQPIITMFVWMNIEPERSDAFLFYFLAVVFVERMTVAWDVWELDREIREGTFAYRILQPVHPIHWAIAENIVYKGLFLVLLAPVWAVAAVFVPALRPTMDAAQTALFLCAVVVGAAVRFFARLHVRTARFSLDESHGRLRRGRSSRTVFVRQNCADGAAAAVVANDRVLVAVSLYDRFSDRNRDGRGRRPRHRRGIRRRAGVGGAVCACAARGVAVRTAA